MPYYGPMRPYQNQRQLGQAQRRANAANRAFRMAAGAHRYARDNNLYRKAYEGLKKWAKGSGKPKRRSFGTQTSMDKWGTPMMRNTVKPLRSKFPSNRLRVRGKGRRKSVMLPKQLTTHPHTVRQTLYLAKNALDDTTKSIQSLQPFELYPSSTQQYLTACVVDLTKTWWGTTTIDGTNLARIGNQVVPPVNSDFYMTGPNNGISLSKRCTMLTLNALPEQPNGLIPNNHYVSGFNIQLDLQTQAPGSQLVTVQVVRRSSSQDPVANGAITTADFQEMANDIKVVDKDKFQTIYQKTIHMPGLTVGRPIKHYRVKKFIKCNLKRNTLRKTSSISSFGSVVGAQIKPHFEFSSGGEMYNQCFLIIKAKRYNNTANVTSRKTSTGSTPGLNNLPDKWDEMTPAKCILGGSAAGASIVIGGFNEPQLNTTGDTVGILAGACVKCRGTVSTYFRVREIKNQNVANTADATPAEDWPEANLEPINVLDEYESDDDHTHFIDLNQDSGSDGEPPHVHTGEPDGSDHDSDHGHTPPPDSP